MFIQATDSEASTPSGAAFRSAAPEYATDLLDNRSREHLDRAAQLVARGEIVAFGFNGIFALIGDVDQPIAARRMAQAKGQSRDETLALVCPPECLGQFIDTCSAVVAHHGLNRLQRLQSALHGLGVILPKAKHLVPSYATENGTVLNVWFEYAPARYLYRQLRRHGVRALIGTSANKHGDATCVDPLHALRVFGGSIPAVVAHDLHDVLEQRRQSSTLVDFTAKRPRLARHGSVTVHELRSQLRVQGMEDLCLEMPVSSAAAIVLH